MLITCAHCGADVDKIAGQVTRARKAGLNLYCSRACAGLGRRKAPKSKEQKVAEKAAYDAEYRLKHLAKRKVQKAAYYAKNHDRDKEREYRNRTMARHVEYCRSPEYRAWKREYDKVYRAKQDYGEFWEAFLLAMEIRDEALRLAGGDYELRLSKGYFNRTSQQRRRDYERLDREEPEIGAMGNLEQGERR